MSWSKRALAPLVCVALGLPRSAQAQDAEAPPPAAKKPDKPLAVAAAEEASRRLPLQLSILLDDPSPQQSDYDPEVLTELARYAFDKARDQDFVRLQRVHLRLDSQDTVASPIRYGLDMLEHNLKAARTAFDNSLIPSPSQRVIILVTGFSAPTSFQEQLMEQHALFAETLPKLRSEEVYVYVIAYGGAAEEAAFKAVADVWADKNFPYPFLHPVAVPSGLFSALNHVIRNHRGGFWEPMDAVLVRKRAIRYVKVSLCPNLELDVFGEQVTSVAGFLTSPERSWYKPAAVSPYYRIVSVDDPLSGVWQINFSGKKGGRAEAVVYQAPTPMVPAEPKAAPEDEEAASSKAEINARNIEQMAIAMSPPLSGPQPDQPVFSLLPITGGAYTGDPILLQARTHGRIFPTLSQVTVQMTEPKKLDIVLTRVSRRTYLAVYTETHTAGSYSFELQAPWAHEVGDAVRKYLISPPEATPLTLISRLLWQGVPIWVLALLGILVCGLYLLVRMERERNARIQARTVKASVATAATDPEVKET